jgi:hypothetical protein
LARESALIACVDTLSLALCGELKAPLNVEAPRSSGEMQSLQLVEKPGKIFHFALSPWPFRGSALTIEGECLALPEGGCGSAWLWTPNRRPRLTPPSAP